MSPLHAAALLPRLLATLARLPRLLRPLVMLALLVGTLLLALVLATGVLLWALVRGRRPGAGGASWASAMHHHAGHRPATPAAPARSRSGEVVDVEAREVSTLRTQGH